MNVKMNTAKCGKPYGKRAEQRAVRLVARGVSVRATAKQIGCSKAAVQLWLAKHRGKEQAP